MSNLIQKIMVYIDGSEQSITAAQYAICLASSTGAELFALYVVNTKAVEDLLKASIFLKDEQLEYVTDMEADSDRYLNYIDEFAIKKGLTLERLTRNGSVYMEIVKAARENQIDLMVIGELSQVRSRRNEFYDETERALHAVNCSVLVVKDEDRVCDIFEALV